MFRFQGRLKATREMKGAEFRFQGVYPFRRVCASAGYSMRIVNVPLLILTVAPVNVG